LLPKDRADDHCRSVVVRQIEHESANAGLSSQSFLIMLPVMERGKPSCGTKKCRKFTTMVNSFRAMLVKLAALTGQYCALNQLRNGRFVFVAVPRYI
jgi:hypothetical protein